VLRWKHKKRLWVTPKPFCIPGASDVIGLTATPTVLGKDITITIKDGKVFLNDTIQVIITDIEASNGVIHVIDAVLLPPQ